jgi:hypothetical protein
MLELIVCLAMATPPQAPPLLSVIQAPPIDCHEVGDLSPTLKREMNVRSPKPMGYGWQWDEKEGVWWRLAGFEEVGSGYLATPHPTRSSTGTVIRRGFRLIGNGGMRQSGSIPFFSGGNCGPRG